LYAVIVSALSLGAVKVILTPPVAESSAVTDAAILSGLVAALIGISLEKEPQPSAFLARTLNL